jgi:hypothetical protein
MRLVLLCVVCLGWTSDAAAAEPVSGRVAQAELFDTSGIGLQLVRGLSDKDRATIKALIPLIEQQTGTKAKFYGALAYAPDEGLVSEALQGAFNFHTVDAADTAAIEACGAAKRATSRACQVAARILPPEYQRRSLSLSLDATRGFFDRYTPAAGAKIFAISRSTGAWAMAPSPGGALGACTQDAKGADDCAIIVRD